ncbi:unnamed protein product [Scytosiphon promiscuus]
MSPAMSSRNAGSAIVPPASRPSASSAQSGPPAVGADPCQCGPVVGSTTGSFSGISCGPPVSDAFRSQVRRNGSSDPGKGRGGAKLGKGSIGIRVHAGQVDQRRVRPCLPISPSTVSGHPGAVREQTTGPTSSSTVLVCPKTEDGQTLRSMSPCKVSGRSSAVLFQARKGNPTANLATLVQPKGLAMDVAVTVSDPAGQSGNHHGRTSSASYVRPPGGGKTGEGTLKGEAAGSLYDKLNLSKESISCARASDAAECTSTVAGGGPKEASEGTNCHGCRTSEQKVNHSIRMGCDGGEACEYWLCLTCFARWKGKSGSEAFFCCVHEGNEWCPCQSRYHPARDDLPSTLDKSVQAKKGAMGTDVHEHGNKGAVGATIFKLPAPTTATPSTAPALDPSHTRVTNSKGSTTYSVCTSLGSLRVAVVKTDSTLTCSQRYCRCIKTLNSAARISAVMTGGGPHSAPLAHCSHAEVVLEQEASSASIPPADAALCGAAFESALERVPTGTFDDNILRAMRQRTDRAAEERVPLLVGMGDTKWFAVREGAKFDGDMIGGWAHVKWERDGGTNFFQCKANNGRPCSDSLSKRVSGRCVHAAIVAVHIFDQYGEELEQNHPMRDAKFGHNAGTSGVKEGDAGDLEFASYTQREDPVGFDKKMAMLRMIMSLYKFPVEEPSLKKEAYGRDKIRVHGRVCLGCGRAYDQLPDSSATLLAQGPQGPDVRLVKLERRECRGCNLGGWAGDDIYEDGVFNYNGKLVIEVRILYQLRRAVRAGVQVQAWVRIFLQPRLDDIRWLASKRNRILASRIQDDSFHAVVQEAYFAFEALRQHPYDFVSYLHGRNPELLCMNDSAQMATDDICTAEFEVARVERYVDTDLQHALVIISMISKMVFRSRLRWVTEAAPTFGPHNRVSNLMLRTQRESMAPEGSPEYGDAGALMRALGGDTIGDLSGKSFDDLKTIYRLCFPGGEGIGRYPGKSALLRCFKDLRTIAGIRAAGGECSKSFIGRTTTGVGELFASDGVVCAHVLQLVAESPADTVDMMAHLMVQPCLLTTNEPCTVAPIAEKLYPGLLENAGALPRNAEGEVSLAGMQHLGAYPHQFPDDRHVKRPPDGFPSTPASLASGTDPVRHVDNAYALFARANTSRAVQAHVDFRALLERAAAFEERKRQSRAAAAAGNGAGGVDDTSCSPTLMCEFAVKCLKSLHADGRYAMSLFEVVLVFALWFRAAGYEAVDDGTTVPEAGGGEGGADGILPERAMIDFSKSELFSISSFFMRVLRVAVGSVAKTPGLDMEAPEFFTDDVLFDLEQGITETALPLRRLEDVVKLFHKEKVSYITDHLGAADDRLRERAHALVQAGVGFGVTEHSVKELQMALSQDSLGGGVDENGRVAGYSISFNFKRVCSFGEYGHFYAGRRVGLWLAPDGPHKRNHQGPCGAMYGGLARCPQLTGVECGVHIYGRSKNTKDMSGVSGLGFDALVFNVTLTNEVENAAINRKTCDLAVTRAVKHPHDRLRACCSEVWICGRCFCDSPLMRSFGEDGRLRLTRTDESQSDWTERT